MAVETTRRQLVGAGLAVSVGLVSRISSGNAQPANPEPTAIHDSFVIDVAGGPDNLDPALTRSVRDWSIVHSIYDSILDLSNDGDLIPLAAESFTVVDDHAFEVTLREGLTFHDGSPITSDAIDRAIHWVQVSEGPAARNFSVIERVDIIDDRTARLITSDPAPWLPSQLAVWLVLFPTGMTPQTFETAPVGSGPYRFVSHTPGSNLVLERNPDYAADSPKGTPLAERVTYRFVPEATTRVADLISGGAQLIDTIGQEQSKAIKDGGGEVFEEAVLGTSFLRIVNDVAPFDDPLVRKAINVAIDVESIGTALVSENVHRLASIYPDERSIGFDAALEPFPYDPDQARALLAEAGYPDGFETRLQFTGGNRDDIFEAIAANLADVGIRLSIETTELATFNGTWQDPASAPLRYVSWRPVYDPHTLLSLMFASTGPLSRYSDPEADALIQRASVEVHPDLRSGLYQELGQYFQESPPAVFLWNLTGMYGARDAGLDWSPRGDEYILPMSRN